MEIAPLGPRPVAQHLESVIRRHPVSNADRTGRLLDDLAFPNGCSKLIELRLEVRDSLLLDRHADPRLECEEHVSPIISAAVPGKANEHDANPVESL